MTKETILRKAIEKARNSKLSKFEVLTDAYLTYPYQFIFSHDFAKAFWGGKPEPFHPIENGKLNMKKIVMIHTRHVDGLDWKGHLQQMVLEKDPIKYLAKSL